MKTSPKLLQFILMKARMSVPNFTSSSTTCQDILVETKNVSFVLVPEEKSEDTQSQYDPSTEDHKCAESHVNLPS